MIVFILIAGVIGYLLGALPFGHLVARAKGVNIFELGSKTPGATNVRRVLGNGPGNLVLALDILKGAVASAWGLLMYTSVSVPFEAWGLDMSGEIAGSAWLQLGLSGLVGAMLGHSFSCFTKFKGGKGVATGAGGFLVLMPIATLLAAGVWLFVFLISRYVSLASMLAAISLPVSVWWLERSTGATVMAIFAAVFVMFRHRENCRRLLNGTENRFVKHQPDDPEA